MNLTDQKVLARIAEVATDAVEDRQMDVSLGNIGEALSNHEMWLKFVLGLSSEKGRRLVARGSFLPGCDFSGKDLRGADFRTAKLTEADFSRANVAYCNFSEADLSGAKFSQCDMRDATITNSKLENVCYV